MIKPKDWKELTNEDGETLYYHTLERKLQKVHPLILRYQEVYLGVYLKGLYTDL